MRDVAWFVWLLPRNVGVLLIRAYRAIVSPLYGDVCRYYPSCSAYGLGSVQHRGLVVGSALTGWRILRCNPWSAGGVDDVRMPKRFRFHVTRFGFVIPAGWAGTSRRGGRHVESVDPTSRRHEPAAADAHAGHSHADHSHASAAVDAAASSGALDIAGTQNSPITSRKD
ncbi:membrane protein insertion efficiency factor YidD [Agromyces aurantiacus]|uniref:Putative membrane protein insertion efficiency factor n=1 Tax=Agromyces aurantiacus TaxID=165814 RepID=A0ABV9R4N1_9MICO|nr:putative membrane protein insertion efficiency factor [Agromyces aurantiacus]